MLRAAPTTSEPDASEADAAIANRANILTCIVQWAAANARGDLRKDGKVGAVDDNCIANLLEVIDWAKMSVSKVLAILDFIIAQCDDRSVARMAGVANHERECLRRVLAEMVDDGFEVINVDEVQLAGPTVAEVA